MLCLGIMSLATLTATGQEDKIKENKSDEIVIRKSGDKDVTLTLELKNDDIFINGKPLSDFRDDNISVTKRKKMMRRGIISGPGHPGGNMFFDGNTDGEPRPFLGVTTQKDDKGVKITDISEESAAEKAGLKEGDVITSIDNKKISDPEGLMDAVTSYKPNQEVKVYYDRNGKSNNARVVLGERKESRIRSFTYDGDFPGVDEDFMKKFEFELPRNPDAPLNRFWPNPKRLGVRIADTENDSGATITNVEKGSAAEKAGLKKDDIITEVDGKKVKNVDEARDRILGADKNSYTVKARRSGSEMLFEVKIPKKLNAANL